ncbi:MAG: hypothetical protein M1825_002646 [Sarcosagium campestre]|nr:MAG: hypothetical protein M1825_002646 [Sarcosagium campestre]
MPASSSSSSHKGRPKNKSSEDHINSSNVPPPRARRVPKASASIAPTAFPLAALLWPAKGTTSRWVILPLILMAAGLMRWAVGLWPYSGFKAPPMHGDFEAQRHWMEVTTSLPISQWYFHDLDWWGLDYPPLTAYHSWLLGTIGSIIDPSWFKLYTSRGIDDPSLKVYMRATVLISEYLIYEPSIIVLLRNFVLSQGVQVWQSSLALVAILMQPATILIDHGHFQYNTVMLGLMVASLSNFIAGRRLWACIFFVGALGFKQMALYYAPAIFSVLLSACIKPRLNPGLLFVIAFVTLAAFAILFAPFALGGLWYGAMRDASGDIVPIALALPETLSSFVPDSSVWYYPLAQQLSQSIHRIFPFARGIFEDKVANLWCVLNVLMKLRQFPQAVLQKVSLLATVMAITPPCAILLLEAEPSTLLYGVAATAWGFFLCSFQVHEKSVLLPLLPMTLALGTRAGFSNSTRAWVGWANILASWTLYPLLQRDGLRMPYAVITLLWAYLLGLPPVSFAVYTSKSQTGEERLHILTAVLHAFFYFAMIVWHIGEAFVAPPVNKPDLWVVLNVAIGAAGFLICYLWCLWKCLDSSHLLANWTVSGSRKRSVKKSKRR